MLERKYISPNTSANEAPTLRQLLTLESKSATNNEDTNSDTDEDDDEDEEEIKPSRVLLEDWGPRLGASKCFCKDCEILFPTRNALDAHKMAAHSFLVALDANKAIKSTAKDFRGGAAALSSASEGHVAGTSKYCNHCNKTFANDTALISHLYQILTSGKSNSKKPSTNKDPMESETKVLVSPEVNNKLFLRCSICGIYFINKNSYEKHVIKGHGIVSPNVNRGRGPYNGKCWFCPVHLLNKENFNKHVLRAHPKYFNSKRFSTIKQKAYQTAAETVNVNDNLLPKPASSAVKYQCLKCSEIFPEYTAARNHRSTKHPELKSLCILNKIHTKKNAPSLSLKNTEPVNNPIQIEYPIPIKILYRCENCETYFTSCMLGLQHSENCKKNKGDWRCLQCRRVFMLADKDVHLKQHFISRHRFVVHVCSEALYHRIINMCPKCKLYFHEQEFLVHYRKGCLDSSSMDCFRCNLSIGSSSAKTHTGFHEQYDFGIYNLILVEFAPKIVDLSLKRKLEPKEDVASKNTKLKSQEKVTLYYCSHCKCSMLSKRYFDLHSDGECVNITSGRKHICKICGIMVSSKRHADFHERNKNWKLSNFKFISLQNGKVMNPPIPDYPTCEKCGVSVIQSSALENHECGANYKSCWYCKKKFTDLACLLHARLHIKKTPKSEPSEVEFKEIVPKPATRTYYARNQLPELLKKYEMLKETWNILYLCRTCDIVHDSYDSAVEHCQNHFNMMESYDVTIRRCQTCDLKFDSKCFEKHRSLHSQNKDVRKESFHILYYSYEDLLLPKWLDIFQSLPDEQSQHILQQSLYKNSRNFKMTVIADGAPEYTLYVCGKCDIYASSFDFMTHIDCSKESRRYHCRVCNFSFLAHSVRDAHEFEHKKTESFRVVLFNSPDDSEFNKALTDNKSESKAFLKTPKESMVHYYRCTNCKCCIKRKKCIKAHECYNMSSRRSCGRCGLTFWRAAIAPHVLLHRTNPYCTREHIRLTDFNPTSSMKTSSSNVDDKTAKIYKCLCGLHFTSSTTIDKHLQTCGTELDIAKENCSKCDLLFDTHELFNHLCKHHSSDKYIQFDVEEVTSKKPTADKAPVAFVKRKYITGINSSNRDPTKLLYKCKKCDIYYLSVNALKYHYLYNKHQTKDCTKCKLCGLQFSPITLKKHIKLHHMKYKYKLKDFQVTVVDYKLGSNGTLQLSNKWHHDHVTKDMDNVEYKMSKKFLSTLNVNLYSKKIYKCSTCSLHFLATQTLYSHKHNAGGRYCKPDNRGVKCNICGFAFSIQTLPRHKYIHHDKMKLQNVIQIPDPFEGHTPKPHSIKRKTNLNKITSVDTNNEIIRRAKAIKGLNASDYDNKLYQCEICKIHFLSVYTVKGHFSKKRHNLNEMQCTFCGLLFTEQSLVRHVYVHHLKMKLKRRNFKIIVKNYNYAQAGEHHTAQWDDKVNESDEQDTETDEQGNEIQDQNTSKVVDNEVKDNKLTKKQLATLDFNKYSSRLYKCGLCDAHFLRPTTLLTHYAANRHSDAESKCNECGLSFTPKTMLIHKHIHHRRMKLKKHDMEIIRVGKKTTVVGSQIYDENIFKCVDCDLHFFHIVSADHHLNNVDGDHVRSGSKCDICGLNFSHRALLPHKKIHHHRMNLQRDDFKIHLIGSSISGINWKMTEDEDDVPSHVIEYNSQKTHSNDEPVLDDISDSTDTVSINSELKSDSIKYGSNKLYKCTLCSVHFFTESTVESHYNKLRDKIHEIATVTCKQCNLTFSKKIFNRHQEEHHDKMKLEAKDFQIIPFSEYNDNYFGNNYLYRCSICKSHFTRESSLENHCRSQNHSSNKLKCSICGFKFLKVGYYKHVPAFHIDMKLRRQDIKVWEITDGKLVPVDDDHDDEEVPVMDPFEDETDSEEHSTADTDLWKAEVNLNTYDNTIYKCEKCPLHFMTLLSARKHSKCRMDNSSTVGSCTICGLIFGPMTLPKHMYVHHEFHQLNKEDFRVIERPAPTTEKFKHVHGSWHMEKLIKNEEKFNFSRQSVESDSNTIYRCNKCNVHFLTLGSFTRHDHNSVFKNKCSECSLQFTNRSIARHRLIHHEKLNLKFEDFKVIDGTGDKIDVSSIDSEVTRDTDLESVASRFDADLYDSLDATDVAETSSVSTIMSEHGAKLRTKKSNASGSNISMADLDENYDETIYRCYRCNICFMDKKNCELHSTKCTTKMIRLECDICNHSFSIKLIGKHKLVHHQRLKLSKDDFKIVTIGEIIVKVSEKGLPDLSTLDKSLYNNELYKCSKCNIHFVGKSDFEVHMKSKYHEILKYHCTICKLPFSLRALPIHIFIHHEEMQLSTEHFFVISDEDTDQKILSGVTGKVNQKNENLIMTSSLSDKPIAANKKHTANNDNSIVQSSSDLDSSTDTSEIPEIEHTDENEAKANEFCIKLYKCGPCNVYYMTQSTCYKHMLKHKSLDSIEYIECKICGFQFRILSLHKHILKHHNKEFKLENVLIEEYLPNENGPPTLDVYFANYKLQSRLVSTTSEKSNVTSTKSYDVSSIGGCIETPMKPCTMTSKDCIETDSIESENISTDIKNEQANHCETDNPENISVDKVQIENESANKEFEEHITEIAKLKLVQQDTLTDNDCIIVNSVTTDTNNDEIEEIQDKEIEEMSSEIENIINFGHNINNTTDNTVVNTQVLKTKLRDSVSTENLNTNMDIIYVIEDDELANTNSIIKALPDLAHNTMSMELANDNLGVYENKTDGNRFQMNDNLNIDNCESINESEAENALLTERVIIDISDEENQIDNLKVDTVTHVATVLNTNKYEEIIEIE